MRRCAVVRSGLVVACALTGGCIPVALPPMGIGAAGGFGNAAQSKHVEAVFAADAKVRPLAAVGSARTRPIDVGAGIALEASGDFVRYGPALDVRTYPLSGALSPTARARLGMGVEGRVFWDDRGNAGPNAALFVTGELAGWTNGDCSTSTSRNGVLFGCYYGETGVGVRLQASHGFMADAQVWTVTLGLEVRIPLLIAIMFFIPSN